METGGQSETREVTSGISMEQLFREAMLLHRNTVKELGTSREECKRLQNSKKSLMDKAKGFQRESCRLKEENSQLKDLLATLQNRSDGSGCKTCPYLQQSMDSLSLAYNNTLQEKDRTINMLQERLAEVIQMKSGQIGKAPSTERLRHCYGDTSPDTTSARETNAVSKSTEQGTSPDSTRANITVISPGNQVEKDDISPGTRRTLLRLSKDRQKRNRYQEAPLGDVKPRSRETTPESQKRDCLNSTERRGEEAATCVKENESENQISENAEDTHKISCKRRRLTDGDCSLSSDIDSPGENVRSRKLRRKNLQCPNIIVPETMVVDYFEETENGSDSEKSLDENSETEDSQCFGKDRAKSSVKLDKADVAQPAETQFEIGPPKASSTQIPDKTDTQQLHIHVGPPKASSTQIPDKTDTQQLNIGPPKASSTQVFAQASTYTQPVPVSKTSNVSDDVLDEDLTIMEVSDPNQTVVKNSPQKLRVKTAEQDVGKTVLAADDDIPSSPVFFGSKGLIKNAGIRSPCLFEDEKLDEDVNDEALSDDAESPFLLRKQIISSPSSKFEARNLLDESSQSPSLLHHTRSKPSSGQSNASEHSPAVNQSQTRSQTALRRSTRSQNTSVHGDVLKKFISEKTKTSQKTTKPKDLKQTTLTQTFDAEKTFEADRMSSLQEIQNIESRLSPDSKTKTKCRNNSEKVIKETENCLTFTEFKKPVSPPSKKLKRSPKSKNINSTQGKSSNEDRRQSKMIDLDETLEPDHSESVLKNSKVIPTKTSPKRTEERPQSNYNASLDPAVRLSLEIEDSLAPIANPISPRKFILRSQLSKGKTEENFEEESQPLPCSSKSFKFSAGMPSGKKLSSSEDEGSRHGPEADEEGFTDHASEGETSPVQPSKGEMSFNCSFDRVPKKKGPDFAYVDVVRKKDERKKLKAFFCQECEDYFKAMGLPESERANRMQDCSRHRARYIAPSTPEHFWSIGFPDTPECEERGYIRKDSPKGPSKFRRKRRLEKRFKTTAEEKGTTVEMEAANEKNVDPNSSDLVFDL